MAAMLLAGCAGVAGTSVSSKETDDWVSGIRYYEAAPFILVYSDGKNGLTSEVKYLPDTTRKRSLKPYSWLATNNSSFTFAEGVLTNSTSVIDTQAVPKALIDAAKNIALTAAPLLFDEAARTPGGELKVVSLPPPRIYRLVTKPDGTVVLRGGRTLRSDGMTEAAESEGVEITVLAAPAAQQ